MTVLKNILSFTGLTIGVPASLPHRLNTNGVAVRPRIIEANSNGYTITADTVNVTVTRGASAAAAVDVYVEYWHTIEDAQPLPGGIATSLMPFVVQGGGTGGGGAAFAVSAGTQSVSTGTVAFANSNGVTFGMSGSSQITASVAAGGGVALAAAGGTITSGTASLVNANGVFWSVNGQSLSVARVATVSGTNAENVSVLASNAPMLLSNASGNISIVAPNNSNSEGISIAAGQNLTASGSVSAFFGGSVAVLQGTDVRVNAATVQVQGVSSGVLAFFNQAGTNRMTVTGASTNATLIANNLLAILGSLGIISNGVT